MRLDLYLAEQGFCQSRSQARELIVTGAVQVDGVVVAKPAFEVGSPAIAILKRMFVSRAAEKILPLFQEHVLSARDLRCLDIGASTGGFTQVLLEQGASQVTALDVGTSQLHPTLRSDPRVISRENQDIRTFHDDQGFGLIVADVSFISLHHIVQSIDRLARDTIFLLFKPQFEVGPEVRRSKTGVVKDAAAIARVKAEFLERCQKLGWILRLDRPSPQKGKEGNQEFLLLFTRPRPADSPGAAGSPE